MTPHEPIVDAAAIPDDVAQSQKQKVTQSTELVQIAESRFRFAADTDGGTFAVELDGPNLARPLKGSFGLRQQLASIYFEQRGRTASSNALSDALAVIEGRALNASRERIELRVAEHNDSIIIDLGTPDGRCVVVDTDGWQIVDRSPVVFRRTELTGELPVPIPGGSVEALRTVLNVSERSWRSVIGWLVAALIPGLPHPIVLLTGEQGTGKTTAAKVLSDLVDPCAAPLMAPPDRVERWVESAHGSWVVGIDNLSGIPGWLSDALCRAVTGDAIRKRTLYADTGLTVVQFRRCVVLTGIGVAASRGDLAERLLTIELDRIDSTRRLGDRLLQQRFADCHPQVFGGLLDLLVGVLNYRSEVDTPELPRMADYAQILAALDCVTGWDSFGAYMEATDDMAADLVASDPVASAICDLLEREGDWTGTASDLLKALNDQRGPEPAPYGWPKDNKNLSSRVQRSAPGLLSIGIDVRSHRVNRQRTIQIRHVNKASKTTSPTSPTGGDDDHINKVRKTASPASQRHLSLKTLGQSGDAVSEKVTSSDAVAVEVTLSDAEVTLLDDHSVTEKDASDLRKRPENVESDAGDAVLRGLLMNDPPGDAGDAAPQGLLICSECGCPTAPDELFGSKCFRCAD